MHPASGPPVALFVLCALQPTDSLQQQYFRPACQAKTRRLGEATQEIGGTAPASPVQLVPTVAACRLLLYYSTPIDESEAPPGLSRAVPRRVSIPSVGDEARTDPGDGVCDLLVLMRVPSNRSSDLGAYKYWMYECNRSTTTNLSCLCSAHQFWT
jgi:hypothetical protein